MTTKKFYIVDSEQLARLEEIYKKAAAFGAGSFRSAFNELIKDMRDAEVASMERVTTTPVKVSPEDIFGAPDEGGTVYVTEAGAVRGRQLTDEDMKGLVGLRVFNKESQLLGVVQAAQSLRFGVPPDRIYVRYDNRFSTRFDIADFRETHLLVTSPKGGR